MSDNTMQKLHCQAGHALARLHSYMPAMCRCAGDVSQAIEAPAGSAPTGTDAPGVVEAGRYFVSNQGAGVKV